MISRNVKSLSQMAGQEYQLLYRLDGSNQNGKTKYAASPRNTLYRAMNMEPMILPAGTYYLQYEVNDVFMRPILLDRIEMYWDGKTLSFSRDFTWEGRLELAWSDE